MWQDKQNNLLVYDTPDAVKIAEMVPGAKKLVNGYVAAPVSLYNIQLLAYLGQEVPPPMTDATYDWPIRAGRRPREHQKLMANFMVTHPRCFNLSDMGTMKTQAALWAADFIMLQHPGIKTLVVAPLSSLKRTWANAVYLDFLGKRKAIVLHGTPKKRLQLLAEAADFYITNFEGVEVMQEALLARNDIRICLIDEASAYRDPSTKRHKVARKVLAPRDYFWEMTGTPTSNGPLGAYGLAKLINNAYGETFTSYKNRVMYKVGMFKWVPRSGAHVEAARLLQPAIRFAIKDCIDLPPCTTQMRDCELSTEQRKAYDLMKKDLQLLTARGMITAVNEAALRTKLIQISCGAVYGEGHEITHINAAPRLKVLKEVLEEAGEKFIVFAPLTSVLHLLYRELSKIYSCEIVNGEVSPKKRDEIFRKFQEEKNPRCIIADPGTMAHSLDLFAATVIVWYAPTDKTETYLQANKRIDRPGQTKNTTIVHLAATATEREIYRRVENNETMQGAMLKLAEQEE